MILGIGTDIVEVERIKSMLDRHPEGFIRRVLSIEEKEILEKRKDKAQFCSGRWAIKEAVSKALGTGIGKDCAMNEISTTNNIDGKPVVTLTGSALETFNRLGAVNIHISISHEKKYACANVIMES